MTGTVPPPPDHAPNADLMADATIGIVGLGKIGGALVTGMIAAGLAQPHQFVATTGHPESRDRVRQTYGIRVAESNEELARLSTLVVLATKPSKLQEVCRAIGPALQPGALVMSVAAGVPTERLAEWLGTPNPLIRAMPNMPAMIGEGMTGVSRGRGATEQDVRLAEALFSSFGKVVRVDEELLDAVTGLGGSGPAFVYIIIESLAEAGVKVGLPRDTALTIAAQTVLGAAKMVLDSGQHPAKLKEDITTPAGTTIDGIMELEEGKLRVTLIKAVVKATERAQQLTRIKKGASS